jgi:predicted alpha/beta superfamily hydrolase
MIRSRLHALLCSVIIPTTVGCTPAFERHEYEFDSAIVGDSYDIIVLVPRDELGEGPYPTLYYHDGDYLGGREETLRKLMVQERIAPVVVVGIAYQGGKTGAAGGLSDETMERRARDFTVHEVDGVPETGHADEYQQFVRDELVPFVEAEADVIPQRDARTAYGFSAFGLASLYTMLAYNDGFSGYCAGSPSLETDGRSFFDVESGTDPMGVGAWLHMSVGDREDDLGVVGDFEEVIRSRPYDDLELLYEVWEGKGHRGSMNPSFEACLLSFDRRS